ncbi:MAG: hypothetical protein ACPGII_08180, partial [Opitutales bacterium]
MASIPYIDKNLNLLGTLEEDSDFIKAEPFQPLTGRQERALRKQAYDYYWEMKDKYKSDPLSNPYTSVADVQAEMKMNSGGLSTFQLSPASTGSFAAGNVIGGANPITISTTNESLIGSLEKSPFQRPANDWFRAYGGPVKKGQPYVVGERGPEIVVPREDGYVIPNSDAQNLSKLAQSYLLGTPEEEEAFDPTAVAGLGLGNQGINTAPVAPTQLVPGIENITLPTTQYPEITFGQRARADGTQAYPFNAPDRQMSGIERRSGGPEDPFSIFRSGSSGGRGSVGSTKNPAIDPQGITPDTAQPSAVTAESFFGRPPASSPADAAQRLLDVFPSSAQAQDPIRSTFTMPDGTVIMERESGERFT